MRPNLGLILILPAMLVAFQNCGKAASATGSSGGAEDSKSQTVIGSTASYKKIIYDPTMDFSLNHSSSHLEINIENGSLSLSATGTKSCALDADRLNEAREILQNSEICQPGPLAPGMVSCLALGMADISLSNDSASFELRPVICNSGTFLCDGNDARLRSLISDLASNPPEGCK